jgi:hypothetical protein
VGAIYVLFLLECFWQLSVRTEAGHEVPIQTHVDVKDDADLSNTQSIESDGTKVSLLAVKML